MNSGRILISGDWHLGRRSPGCHDRLVLAFLQRTRAAGDHVILNGDIFETLFAPLGESEGAHSEVATLIGHLTREGALERLEGNHDPGTGEQRLVFDIPGLGRVLVEHGHRLDPVHASLIGRAGEAISRRAGRLELVRLSMQVADGVAQLFAGRRIERAFRARCLALVRAEGFALGVFGHVHVSEATPGARYANAGHLSGDTLEYLALTAEGAQLCRLRLSELT